MLTLFAILAACLLVGAALIQWAISFGFRRHFTKRVSRPLAAGRQKNMVVIMSVRGCDPSLGDSLIGVLNQNFEDYQVHLVVDHRTDQAWEFVQGIKQKHDSRGRLTIHELKDPPETCSLKCHAIVQALGEIPDETELIGFLDADVIPHPGWLAELAGPLEDPSIGGVTGGQWFEPDGNAGIGSMVRSVWNSGAMVPTIIFANPWAGSFAMRVDDLLSANLKEIWSRSAVDDGPLGESINGIGLRIEFAPSLIMVNREACTFSYSNRWVSRMLTWSRVYETTFYLTVIHAIFSNSVMLANFGLLLAAIVSSHWGAAAVSATGLIVSGILSVAAYVESRRCVAHSCRLRGETFSPCTVGRLGAVFALVAVAQAVYGISCFRAITMKRIQWREINYELGGESEIRRLNYHPYLPDSKSQGSI